LNSDPQTAKMIYTEIINFINKTKKLLHDKSVIEVNSVIPLAEKTVNFMSSSSDLNYYAVNYYDVDDLYISHSANVAIFSTTIGIGLKYKLDDLVLLCASGILHDVGAGRIPGKIVEGDTDNLTKQEIYFFQKHSELGYNSIKKNTPQMEHIANIAFQHHEKFNGTGFPKKLKGDAIHKHAQIISMVDSFESLIHPRRHRDTIVPPVGIKQILQRKGNFFSTPMLKALLEYISVYPVGVYVKLISNEIGRVLELSPKNPLRPIVRILYNSKGQKCEPYNLNLVDEHLMSIKQCIPMNQK